MVWCGVVWYGMVCIIATCYNPLHPSITEQKMALSCEDLEEKLARLVAEFDQALAEKDEVMAEAERCQRKLDMAQRCRWLKGYGGLMLFVACSWFFVDVKLI